MAHVEPLPLVPATVITGAENLKAGPSRSATVLSRSKPKSIPRVCSPSAYDSQLASDGSSIEMVDFFMLVLSPSRRENVWQNLIMIHVYGITNCDSVRKARRWLDGQAAPYEFHDFKKQAPDFDESLAWLMKVGPERLINKRGTTWRQLSASAQAAIGTPEGAAALLCEEPSLIKRPLVQWPDGAWTVGFSEADWLARLSD